MSIISGLRQVIPFPKFMGNQTQQKQPVHPIPQLLPAQDEVLFGAKKPEISRPLNFNLRPTRKADILKGTEPAQARVVLASTTSFENRLSKLLDNQFSFMTDGADLANKQITNLIQGLVKKGKKDSLGNTFSLYTAKRGVNNGKSNRNAMVASFVESLDKLPKNIQSIQVELPSRLPDGVRKEELLQDLAEAASLNNYNYNFHKSYPHSRRLLKSVEFLKAGLDDADVQDAVRLGQILGDATNLTRHLVDSPANVKTSQYITDKALELTSDTMTVRVREGDWLEGKPKPANYNESTQGPWNTKRMGMFLAVAKGNSETDESQFPRMAEMIYTPKGWDEKSGKTVLLVGKGIIFDTGGEDKKSSESAFHMHGDMAGAAAVIGTMKAIDEIKPNVRVVAVTPLTLNRLGANSTNKHDIVTARNGKSVGIENTDAEGRLVMGDALNYAMEHYSPDLVANIATLTGGKARGVGMQNAVGLSGNNPHLIKQVDQLLKREVGRHTGVENLQQSHHEWVTKGGKGIADVFNSVNMNMAKTFGVLNQYSGQTEQYRQHFAQGAAFMREFLAKGQENTPWVHFDIAGAEFEEESAANNHQGWATGIGVKDLVSLIQNYDNGDIKAHRYKSDVAK